MVSGEWSSIGRHLVLIRLNARSQRSRHGSEKLMDMLNAVCLLTSGLLIRVSFIYSEGKKCRFRASQNSIKPYRISTTPTRRRYSAIQALPHLKPASCGGPSSLRYHALRCLPCSNESRSDCWSGWSSWSRRRSRRCCASNLPAPQGS
jgi:hypothetical protein